MSDLCNELRQLILNERMTEIELQKATEIIQNLRNSNCDNKFIYSIYVLDRCLDFVKIEPKTFSHYLISTLVNVLNMIKEQKINSQLQIDNNRNIVVYIQQKFIDGNDNENSIVLYNMIIEMIKSNDKTTGGKKRRTKKRRTYR